MPSSVKKYVKKSVPLLLFGIVFFLVWATGLQEYVQFEVLRENKEAVHLFVQESFWQALLLYALVYIAVVAFSIPGASFMTMVGGFLFGSVVGTGLVVGAATLGATLLFRVARSSLGEILQKKAGPWLQKMEKGFRENAFSYLLFLRLIPLFPFFIVNLVPAFLQVPTSTFVAATALGIIPGSFVYVSVGTGLGSLLEANHAPSLRGILTPEIMIALAGLAVLSLAPIAYKKMKKRGR